MESRTTIELGTTGLKTWRASLVLAEYLAQNPDLIRNKSVLELGSGVGFLGIVLATLQVSAKNPVGRIVLTDVNPHVLARCEDNLALSCNQSSVHPNVHTRELDWMDALRESRRSVLESFLSDASADLIIGADLVFDPSIIPALVSTLKMGLSSSTTTCGLIALTVRNESTLNEFLRVAESSLVLEEIPFSGEKGFRGLAHSGDADHNREVRVFKLQNRYDPSST